MAAIDFPASPVNGATFTPANGVTYRYVTPPGIWTTANGPADTAITSDTPPANPVPNQLWFNSALAMLYVYYDDGTSQQWVPSMPVPAPPQTRIKLTSFLANGTWTPDVNMMSGYIVGMGGGQGGQSSTGAGGYLTGGFGGNSGIKVTKFFNAPLAASYAVTIGAGGSGGGAGGGAGGDTSVGALLVAPGGSSATAVVGDIRDPTVIGGPAFSINAVGNGYGGVGGGAGGGAWAGAGPGQISAGGNGVANSGGGGGGAATSNNGSGMPGGAGGSGYVYAVEYVKV